MAGLEGTLQTPFGAVQKKTALIAAGGAVLLLGIIYYRQKQLDAAEVVIPEAEINPATGYPYGSPEDAAALAQQAGYVSPPTGGGNTGGGSGYPSNIGYVNNGQWTQAVIDYMVNNGLVEDPTQLSAALGKYITGAYATPTDVGLINQAIAVQGYPPVASPNGYPPSINTTNPTPGGGSPPGGKPSTPTGLRRISVGKTQISLRWNPVSGATSYRVHRGPAPYPAPMTTQDARITWYGLKPNTNYTFSVEAQNASGNSAKSSVITVRTAR